MPRFLAAHSNESVLAHILNTGVVDLDNPKLQADDRAIIECMTSKGAKFNNIDTSDSDATQDDASGE
eukprot:CAMPEP_0116914324 /NCGR_PEP_ID=MMETSP0467-20121206/17259_1 /TAXON_ID=283647 /ORGANISM="Mesodinium pulex, Strain SPMC105" /LENGTH=66 /DNA_ID=CAMNT_0004590763 /DNA_START=297 /DNA_END=497 /DNA_ORIENTATION=+